MGKARTIAIRFGIAGALLLAGGYAAIVYDATREDPISLVSCIKVESAWSAWTCKQVLRYTSFTPEEVRTLNALAAAGHPLSIEDKVEAEEVLAMLIEQGLDVNAVAEGGHGQTALHLAMRGTPPEEVKLLLKHGARVDVRDEAGLTPLDHARRNLKRHPDDPHLPAIIRLLEDAAHKT